jgi:MFS family permease
LVNRLKVGLSRAPLTTAVIYTGLGVLPLFLVSAQIFQLQADIGFGVARLGLTTAAFFGTAALAANPAGRVVSRVGPSAGIRLGSAITVLACVIAGTATVWWMLPVATAVGGVANGFIQVASNIAIFDGVAERRRGVAFGAKQASVPLASVLAGISLPVIGLVFGWRWVFAIAASLALILSISAPTLDRGDQAERTEERLGRPPRSLLWLGVAGIAGAAAGNGLSLFIVPSAVDIGITEAAAGAVLAACSILVVAVRVGAGWLVDRRRSSGHLEMAWMAGLGASGALLLTTVATPPLYLVAMPIALLGAWGWPGIFFFTVVHTYPEYPAKASGLVLSSNLTGTLVGPLIVGFMAGRGNYPGAWLFVSTCATISCAALVVSRRRTSEARLSR